MRTPPCRDPGIASPTEVQTPRVRRSKPWPSISRYRARNRAIPEQESDRADHWAQRREILVCSLAEIGTVRAAPRMRDARPAAAIPHLRPAAGLPLRVLGSLLAPAAQDVGPNPH